MKICCLIIRYVLAVAYKDVPDQPSEVYTYSISVSFYISVLDQYLYQITTISNTLTYDIVKGQLKWKKFLDKYVYLLMQCTKQQFL